MSGRFQPFQSYAVSPTRTALDFECPECGVSPPVDIHGVAYDCNGQPFYPRHNWTRPTRRPLTAMTLPVHDERASLRLTHSWRFGGDRS